MGSISSSLLLTTNSESEEYPDSGDRLFDDEGLQTKLLELDQVQWFGFGLSTLWKECCHWDLYYNLGRWWGQHFQHGVMLEQSLLQYFHNEGSLNLKELFYKRHVDFSIHEGRGLAWQLQNVKLCITQISSGLWDLYESLNPLFFCCSQITLV